MFHFKSLFPFLFSNLSRVFQPKKPSRSIFFHMTLDFRSNAMIHGFLLQWLVNDNLHNEENLTLDVFKVALRSLSCWVLLIFLIFWATLGSSTCKFSCRALLLSFFRLFTSNDRKELKASSEKRKIRLREDSETPAALTHSFRNSCVAFRVFLFLFFTSWNRAHASSMRVAENLLVEDFSRDLCTVVTKMMSTNSFHCSSLSRLPKLHFSEISLLDPQRWWKLCTQLRL